MHPVIARPEITILNGGDKPIRQAIMATARVLHVTIIPVVTNRRILTVFHMRLTPQNKSIVGDIKIIGPE
jgi:ketopantoate hydroxymethyltransferase